MKIVKIIIIVIFALTLAYSISSDNIKRRRFCEVNCMTALRLSINGIVINSHMGWGAKGIKTIKILCNYKDTIFYYPSWQNVDLNFVEPGDSILKTKDKIEYEVYRNGRLLKRLIGNGQICKDECE